MDLFEKINNVRVKRNIKSISQLEAMAGLADGTIRAWKGRDKNPTMATLIKLADILDVSLDYLADRTTEINSHKLTFSPPVEKIIQLAVEREIDDYTANIAVKVLNAILDENGTK